MIGVIAEEHEIDVVREFFELFKTPWEVYQPEQSYEVIIVAREGVFPSERAKLVVHYSGCTLMADCQGAAELKKGGCNLLYNGVRIPVYGSVVSCKHKQEAFLIEEGTNAAVGYEEKANDGTYVRMGYDLFQEIRTLLTVGQLPANANIPTVELHITLLRDLIVGSGASLVEIPPIPDGFSFIACLTHDIDHPSIRLHRWDHTLFGFIYRALVGSLVRVLKRRMPVRHLMTNYGAVAKLPLVRLGLAKDFWHGFDRYHEFEEGAASTFFALPFKGVPGMTANGPAPHFRGSSYGVADIADQMKKIVASGSEVGLHGIDAWKEIGKGQAEKAEIVTITGATNVGVRMHWLYFNEESPATLDKAGFSYDSTVGYNETIGYRAGTAQAFKPFQATHLLELPLHVMDTAMFYQDYLDLTFEEADRRIGSIIDYACQLGGVVTFNWHDRSIAPERLWGDFYSGLVRSLKRRDAWCTSAGKAVSWFRNRRSVVFERTQQGVQVTCIKPDPGRDKNVPGLRLRFYNVRMAYESTSPRYVDATLNCSVTIGFDGRNVASRKQDLNPISPCKNS